jgi:hypothetical protein
MDTIDTPIIPPIGSTNPVNRVIKKTSFKEYFSVSKAKATTNPSGMFCIPIPIASVMPLFMLSSVPPPKPTPTASPSGKLCIVIAIMKSHILFKLIASLPSFHLKKCSWGKNLSANIRNKPPKAIPPATIKPAVTPPPADSIAGTIKLKAEAASITPAPKPSIISCVLIDIFRVNNIGIAPITVAEPAMSDAKNPRSNGFIILSLV